MSTIGTTGFTAINLAGSLAGSQANAGGANERAAEADRRRFSLDLDAMSSRSLDDVAEAELDSDRDADGRRPWELLARPEAEAEAEADEPLDPDADAPPEAVGRRLDVRV